MFLGGKSDRSWNCGNRVECYNSVMERKYQIVVRWSDVDRAHIAEVPELPGCMADGRTRQEAVANVEIAIQEWIERASELGRPIPEHKSMPPRRLGAAIGVLKIIEDDDSHLEDFKEYMP
jgi:predicted RNase H-like HicB family nuclease